MDPTAFELEQDSGTTRRRILSKRPARCTESSSSNPPHPVWNESNPNWDGSAWNPRSSRTDQNQKNSRSQVDSTRSKVDTKRAQEARVDVSSPSSRHDPVVDPNVEDIPPLNVRLAAKRPSPQEVAEHNVTHLPYRAWCETCVASRGVDDPHHRRSFEDRTSEGEIDKVLFDFAFFRPRLAAPSIPILVAISKRTGVRAACVVKDRQGQNPRTIHWVIRTLKEMGHHGPVCLRSDGEPTIRFLLANVATSRRAITLLEHNPCEDSV